MILREFLKLVGLALLPFRAVHGWFEPAPVVEYPVVPSWQVLEQHINGWDCSARYRIWPDGNVDLSWYRMQLDKERFPESPPPMFEVDSYAGVVRFREMTPEEYAVSLKEVGGEPIHSIVDDFSGVWSDTSLLFTARR